MEKLQGPINPYFLENQQSMEGLEVQGFVNIERLGLEEEYEEAVHQLSTPSLDDKMPFLQMLQDGGDSQPFLPFKEPNFLALLSLQHFKTPWELESYGTHIGYPSEFKSEKNPISNPGMAGVNSETNQQNMNRDTKAVSSSSPGCSSKPRIKRKETHLKQTVKKERRKRKRTKAVKNREEVENQRMTHIAVERNRRRQMNEHINSLRFLMPPSYIQRGDQASIIGGAIDFVKELEQLLQSLVVQKRRKLSISEDESTENSSVRESLMDISANMLCASSETIPRIEVTVIQNHVNLKVECTKTHGRLLKAIVLLEELRLTVLHLNVASSDSSLFYSFNLKMEDDCEMKLAEEIAAAAHQIFSQIDG